MSNLFTAVSVEQQEIVVGGVRARIRTKYSYSESKKLKLGPLTVKNGPGGYYFNLMALEATSDILEESEGTAKIKV